MNDKPESRSEQVLELVALCGELPNRMLDLLPGSGEWTQKAVRGLIQQGLVKHYQKDGLRSLRVTKKGWKLLEQSAPARYAYWAQRAQKYCGQRSDLKSRLRTHRIAEAVLILSLAGTTLRRDQKPSLFDGHFEFQPLPNRQPLFYSSIEIKGHGDEATRIKATRAVGLLLSDTARYLVYNCGDSLIKWSSKAEEKLIGAVDGMMELQGLGGRETGAIMLGRDMGTALQLLESDGRFRRQYFSVDGTFPFLLFAPLNRTGIQLLRLYCSSGLRSQLKDILLSNRSPPSFSRYPCDYEEGDCTVLLACEFDLERIVHFRNGLQLFDERGVIVCFDFQREPLEAFFGDLAEIRPVPSSLLEKLMDTKKN